jgi:hypothetical protein
MSAGWAQQIGEGGHAYTAFLRFLDRGPTRSLRKLAAEEGIPFGSLARWSSKFNWVARSQAFDSGIAATAEALEESDLRKEVNAGLWAIVNEGLRDLAAGREGNRSASELAAILSNALKTSESLEPADIAPADESFDVMKLTAEEATWVRQVNAACLVNAAPEPDLRVSHLKEKRGQVYQAVLRALRGETTLSQRDIGKLAVQARQIEKILSTLSKPEPTGPQYNYDGLSLDELQRLDALDAKGRGTPKEELRIYCGGGGGSPFSHDLGRPLRRDVLEGWARLRDAHFEIVDSSGNARTIAVDELRTMCTEAAA